MKLEPPKSVNYAAQVIKINHVVDLPGLDNLVGVPAVGHQALTTLGVQVGDLMIALTAETALSEEYASHNNLYREPLHNQDRDEKGYLDRNARIKALKLRGHRSDALLMPLSSVEFTGVNWLDFEEGDTFDSLNGHDICKKYEIPRKQVQGQARSKVDKAWKRVTDKQLPQHLETDQYHRSKFLITGDQEVIVTQKLHGSSWRGGRVPVLRKLKLYEKLLKKLGVHIQDWEFDAVYGSRKVIKDAGNVDQGYYASDIWVEYGQRIADLIPEGYVAYGELIGFTPDGTPIQRGYTYHLPDKQMELFIYRIAVVNRQGNMADLSWEGVKAFCRERGLKWVPELDRIGAGALIHENIEEILEEVLDTRFAERKDWVEEPLPLSDKKTVDEGVCFRIDGLNPLILKAKAPAFLLHESKQLDAGIADMESVA